VHRPAVERLEYQHVEGVAQHLAGIRSSPFHNVLREGRNNSQNVALIFDYSSLLVWTVRKADDLGVSDAGQVLREWCRGRRLAG
jgi:hypothetical protein